MANSSFYDVFERMWQHVLSKCNDYVLTDVFDNHVNDMENPHSITAEQLDAYTKEEVDTRVALSKVLVDTDDDGILFFANMLEDASEVLV